MSHYDFTQNRDTIFSETACVLSHTPFDGKQWILRLAAPLCASKATAGSFVHLQCDPMRPLRRPISIMQTNPSEGWIELLYKVVGEGTELLSHKQVGDALEMLGPIGKGFITHPDKPRTLLIGGGVGLPPMIFIAQQLKNDAQWKPFCILGSEVPFPFSTPLTDQRISGIPIEVSATMPLLQEWGIANRLASLQNYIGCFQGYVTDLARRWLQALSEQERQEVEIFSCGPTPMLAAVAKLAKEFGLPCQVSLEEYMACAVGGCAGCVVRIETETGASMQRVCVDGPVFDSATVPMLHR